MIQINNYDQILEILEMAFRERYEKNATDRLIGILFAPPKTEIGDTEILRGLDYFHYRSGNNIDFFCVGYVGENHPAAKSLDIEVGGRTWWFSNKIFNDTRRQFEKEISWRYSGEADLILAVAEFDPAKGDVKLNFTNCIVFDLDKMKRDNAILSVRRLFEELFRFSEEYLTGDPIAELRSSKSKQTIGKSVWLAFLETLPDAASKLYEIGWKQGYHYQQLNLQAK